MDKPYCIIDGKEYQLYGNGSNGREYRFIDNKLNVSLNDLWSDYMAGIIDLRDVLDVYVQIGLTYDFVFNYFSKSGCYGSARRVGDYLDFELFTDDEKTNEYYNDTAEEDLRTDVEDILYSINEGIHLFNKKDIIKKLNMCIELLKD